MSNNARDCVANDAVIDSAEAVRLLKSALAELDRIGAATAAAHVSNVLESLEGARVTVRG